MSKSKVTIKLPSEALAIIKREAARAGLGVQNLAGEIFMYGFNIIREQQKAAEAAKKTEEVQDEQVD